MSDTHTFSMDLRVFSPAALYQAALHYATTTDGMAKADAIRELKPRGKVDVHACLIMLLDPGALPGCEIFESTVD